MRSPRRILAVASAFFGSAVRPEIPASRRSPSPGPARTSGPPDNALFVNPRRNPPPRHSRRAETVPLSGNPRMLPPLPADEFDGRAARARSRACSARASPLPFPSACAHHDAACDFLQPLLRCVIDSRMHAARLRQIRALSARPSRRLCRPVFRRLCFPRTNLHKKTVLRPAEYARPPCSAPRLRCRQGSLPCPVDASRVCPADVFPRG